MIPLATHSLWLRDDGNLSGCLIIVQILEIAKFRYLEHPRVLRGQFPVRLKIRIGDIKELRIGNTSLKTSFHPPVSLKSDPISLLGTLECERHAHADDNQNAGL